MVIEGLTFSSLVWIVVANYNGGDYLESFLSSCDRSKYSEYPIVVVDNGSSDRSEEAAFHHERTSLIRLGRNIGVEALNIGIRIALRAGAEYIFYADNDLELDVDCLSNLVRVMKHNERLGILAPLLYTMRFRNKLEKWGAGTIQDRFGNLSPNLLRSNVSEFVEVDAVGASMVKRDVFEKSGLFDPIFFFHSADQDLCARAKRADFMVAICPSAKMWHAASGTVSKIPGWKSYFFSKNQLVFLGKHNKKETIGLLPLLVLKIMLRSAGVEVKNGHGTRRFAMSFPFAAMGTIDGLRCFLSGGDSDLFRVKGYLTHRNRLMQ